MLPPLRNSVLSEWECSRQNVATNDLDRAIPGSTCVGESHASISELLVLWHRSGCLGPLSPWHTQGHTMYSSGFCE